MTNNKNGLSSYDLMGSNGFNVDKLSIVVDKLENNIEWQISYLDSSINKIDNPNFVFVYVDSIEAENFAVELSELVGKLAENDLPFCIVNLPFKNLFQNTELNTLKKIKIAYEFNLAMLYKSIVWLRDVVNIEGKHFSIYNIGIGCTSPVLAELSLRRPEVKGTILIEPTTNYQAFQISKSCRTSVKSCLSAPILAYHYEDCQFNTFESNIEYCKSFISNKPISLKYTNQSIDIDYQIAEMEKSRKNDIKVVQLLIDGGIWSPVFVKKALCIEDVVEKINLMIENPIKEKLARIPTRKRRKKNSTVPKLPKKPTRKRSKKSQIQIRQTQVKKLLDK